MPDSPDFEPHGILQKLYRRLGQRQGQALFGKLTQLNPHTRRWTAERVLAHVIAALVHATTFAFIACGVWIMFTLRGVLGVVLGLGVAAIGVALFPRFGKTPPDVLPRHRFRTLYALADRICEALQSPKVDGIVTTPIFNASFTQVGLHRRRYVALGLPYCMALDAQEIVALLAHEIAHGVNGDPNRSLFVGSALRTLTSWYNFLQLDFANHNLFLYLPQLVFRILSGIPYLSASVLVHLIWRDSQRSEYLADKLAAQVAGAQAKIRLLHKSQLHSTFRDIAVSVSYRWDIEQQNIFSEIRRYSDSMPQREWERLKRIEQGEHPRLDSTHPPIPLRIAFLESLPDQPPQVVCTTDEHAAIRRELGRLEDTANAQIVSIMRSNINTERLWLGLE